MTGTWWSPESTINVVKLLCLVSPVGAVLGWYASLGRRRAVIISGWVAVIVIYAAVAIAGVLGLLIGQPDYVWVPLAVTGSTIAFVFSLTLRPVLRAHERVELRRTIARDL
jgi:hypothetical protein